MTKNLDAFSKNIILIFSASSLVNFFNLLFQLLIAHQLSPTDFAALNSLISILMLLSAPLVTIVPVIAKYGAEFKALNQIHKVRILFCFLLKRVSVLTFLTFLFFCFASPFILEKLKIYSVSLGYIFAALMGLSLITPVFLGLLSGLELFNWSAFISVTSGAIKLIFAFIFIRLGYSVVGAMNAFLLSSVILLIISFLPIKKFLSLKVAKSILSPTINNNVGQRSLVIDGINIKEIFLYFLPVAASSFCFMFLVNSDMILVKYFFSAEKSGVYSIAQMLGKIFLFLPSAISIVMFPRTSSLSATNADTAPILKRSLGYALVLCIFAGLTYNLMPSVILKILTGKALPQAIALGRLFSFSMICFTLSFILIQYFLSIKDLRFIKYLVTFTVTQLIGIILFHKNLYQVQLVLCVNALALFLIHFFLAYPAKKQSIAIISS